MATETPPQSVTTTISHTDQIDVGTESKIWWSSMFTGITPASVHPGHILLVTSLPFCYKAYRGYATTSTSLDQVVNKVYNSFNTNHAKSVSAELLEDNIRRAIGFTVAGKALRVASYASLGGFCLGLSMICYVFQWKTVPQATYEMKQWATGQRKRFDQLIGIQPSQRIDEDHPEYQIIQNMSEEEEYKHISETYFPFNESGEEIQKK